MLSIADKHYLKSVSSLDYAALFQNPVGQIRPSQELPSSGMTNIMRTPNKSQKAYRSLIRAYREDFIRKLNKRTLQCAVYVYRDI